MAQPTLSILSVGVSRYLGDEVASESANGKLYSAADRCEAINRALGVVYTELLHEMGDTQFLYTYPEWKGYAATKTIYPTKDPDIRKVYTIYNDSKIIKEIPRKHYVDAKYDTDSKWYASADNPGFIEYENSVEVVGVGVTDADEVEYLKQPVDVTVGGSDISLPYAWHEVVIQEATEILKRNQQIT